MRKWYPAVLTALALVISIIAYGHLPDPMPTHWNIHGEVDGYGPRFVGAFLNPLIMVAIAFMIPVLPKIDPRGRNYEKFGAAYLTMMNATITLMFVVHIFALSSALGMNIPIQRIIPAAVGLLFVVIGNLLPRVRPNWMVGIRNPWTLSSDRVWERTHRVGGYLMMGLGVLLVLTAPFAPMIATMILIVGGAIAAGIGITVYAYVLWKQEKRA
ncbi:MAG TPA: DUF1648 domain-containing protein [Gemmatimonadaceae bacterium]